MEIVRSLEGLSRPWPAPVVTIGNFDGVHLGHREIFRRLVSRARELDGTSVVFTFIPHPRKVLDPVHAPLQISTDEEKERLIAASCIDVLICAPFTREMANYPAGRFVREILVERIGLRRLIVGYDYAFGKGREGDVDFLRQEGARYGFEVEVLPPVTRQGEVYSSTRIRELIAAGRVREVVPLLGRHFSLEGTVIHGLKRGKTLGFPTANLATAKELLPLTGVYAVKVRLDRREIDAVANIGRNPTFGPGALSLEVHLLDFHEEIYGRTLRLYFMDRLRDEKTFPSVEALRNAIGEDVLQARRLLADARVMEYQDYLDCGLQQEGRQ